MRREHEVLFEDLVLYRRVGVLISVAAAVCWTLAYSFIIRRGFKDRMPGMPLAALSANIVWEAVSVVWYVDGDIKLLIMQGVWLGFDLPILVQILRFGRNQPQHALLAKHYHLIVIASLVAFGMVFAGFTAQFGDKTGWMIAFLPVSYTHLDIVILGDSDIWLDRIATRRPWYDHPGSSYGIQ